MKCLGCKREFNPASSPYREYGPECGRKHGAKTNAELCDLIITSHARDEKNILADIEDEDYAFALTKPGITEEEAFKVGSALYDEYDTDIKCEQWEYWNLYRKYDVPREVLSGLYEAGFTYCITQPNFDLERFKERIFDAYHNLNDPDCDDDQIEAGILLAKLGSNRNTDSETLKRIALCDSFNTSDISQSLLYNNNTPDDLKIEALEHLLETPEYHDESFLIQLTKIKGVPFEFKREAVANFLNKELFSVENMPNKLEEYSVEQILNTAGNVKGLLLTIEEDIREKRNQGKPDDTTATDIRDAHSVVFDVLYEEIHQRSDVAPELKELANLLK